MGSKMLIDASHQEETRVVVLKGNRIEEFDFESAARRQLKGNIYLAKVTRVEPSLQAAFVEYGGNRHGFLAFAEIHPDYYQIPLADRMALLQDEAEDHANDDDDHNGNGHRNGSPERHRDRADRLAEEADQDSDSQSDPGDDQGEANRSEALTASHDAPSLSEDVPAADDDGETADEPGDQHPAAASDAPADDSDDGDDATGPDETIAAAPSVKHGVPGEMGDGVEDVEEDFENQTIESIGAEDAMEEVPQRKRRAPRRQYKIQEVIKRRQVILVQVVKEERGNKGAALTTYLSLAGRYCVLMPNTARGGGISRKITDSGDRRRLKDVAKEIEVPQGMGLIVRTAGAQRTKTEIKRDYDYLLRLWESVRDLTLKSTAPALVYEEGSLVKRAIRDLYTKEVDEVVVEGDGAYREAKDFMKMLMPSHAKNVKPYKDARPLFSRYQAESQLDGLYSPNVTLPSGGYMVINQTEALVSVDINSGKSTREHNIEDTALRTNLEASDEIARQLRLRDLAGLVVIDFIDMEEKRNNRNVERRLKEALKNDRARIQVGRISHFGLLEMSRQRLRPGLLEGSSRTCPHCEGRGVVRSVSSCGLSVLRAIEEHLMARKPENLTVKCTREIAFYILNEKRDNLLTIETSYGISVFIIPSDELKGSQALIERAVDRNIPPRKVQTAPVRIDSAFSEDEEVVETEVADAEDNAPDEKQSSGNGQSEDGQAQNGDKPDGRKRRRRRGRRGGRGREDQSTSVVEATAGETTEDTAEIPGLGDQPAIEAVTPSEMASEADFAPSDTPEEAATPIAEDVAEAVPADTEAEVSPPKPARRPRTRTRKPKETAKATAPEPEAKEAEVAAPVAAEPLPAEPVVVVPLAAVAEAEAPAEPSRKWQPPAPTIAVVPTERKTGWWSKR